MANSHNVFISHRHEDDLHVLAFKKLMAGRGVDVRDSSIVADKPNNAKSKAYIRSQILAPGIKWAGKVVVLITPDTKNHPWVDWEIEYANRLNKQIIGVWASGSGGCDVPEPLERHADAIVGWNGDRILDALGGERVFERPDGSERGPQPVNRIGC